MEMSTMKNLEQYETLNESLPSNIAKWVRSEATIPQGDNAKDVAKWVKKLGKSITNGTTIGKEPQTLILDIKHHGSEIRINRDGVIELYGVEISDYAKFKEVWNNKN